MFRLISYYRSMIVSIHVLTFAEISVSCNYKFWYLKETKDLSKYIFTALFQVEVCVLVCISFLGNEKSSHNSHHLVIVILIVCISIDTVKFSQNLKTSIYWHFNCRRASSCQSENRYHVRRHQSSWVFQSSQLVTLATLLHSVQSLLIVVLYYFFSSILLSRLVLGFKLHMFENKLQCQWMK